MKIYRENNIKEFELFLKKDEDIISDRTRYLSTLPLFTISDELLIKILKRNNFTESEIKKITQYKKEEFKYINNIIKNNKISDYIYIINENEFNNEKPILSLNNIFYNKKIYYTYSEYIEHLNLTRNYAKKEKNYKLNYINEKTFKNITITILKNNYVLISKSCNPTIHFIIEHPKLIEAIENFNPLVKE